VTAQSKNAVKGPGQSCCVAEGRRWRVVDAETARATGREELTANIVPDSWRANFVHDRNEALAPNDRSLRNWLNRASKVGLSAHA
jgi:hypothetical protein